MSSINFLNFYNIFGGDEETWTLDLTIMSRAL